MPRPSVTIVPCGSEERSREAWGVGGVGVAIEMRRPYPPVEAMVVAGYILLGLGWPERYRTLRLPASLEMAYRALEQHFEQVFASPPPTLVTIPKSRALPAPATPATPALADGRATIAPLPPPARPQLTHTPPPETAILTEGEDQ
jgi:hypothetical protein